MSIVSHVLRAFCVYCARLCVVLRMRVACTACALCGLRAACVVHTYPSEVTTTNARSRKHKLISLSFQSLFFFGISYLFIHGMYIFYQYIACIMLFNISRMKYHFSCDVEVLSLNICIFSHFPVDLIINFKKFNHGIYILITT